MTDDWYIPKEFYLVYTECAALIWSQDVTHAQCAKLGNICILFVGIVNNSAFCVMNYLQLAEIKSFNVGKENSSKPSVIHYWIPT